MRVRISVVAASAIVAVAIGACRNRPSIRGEDAGGAAKADVRAPETSFAVSPVNCPECLAASEHVVAVAQSDDVAVFRRVGGVWGRSARPFHAPTAVLVRGTLVAATKEDDQAPSQARVWDVASGAERSVEAAAGSTFGLLRDSLVSVVCESGTSIVRECSAKVVDMMGKQASFRGEAVGGLVTFLDDSVAFSRVGTVDLASAVRPARGLKVPGVDAIALAGNAGRAVFMSNTDGKSTITLAQPGMPPLVIVETSGDAIVAASEEMVATVVPSSPRLVQTVSLLPERSRGQLQIDFDAKGLAVSGGEVVVVGDSRLLIRAPRPL